MQIRPKQAYKFLCVNKEGGRLAMVRQDRHGSLEGRNTLLLMFPSCVELPSSRSPFKQDISFETHLVLVE